MYATLKKRAHSAAMLCLLIMLIQSACKKNTSTDKHILSPEEVNELTIDSGIGGASYRNQLARSASSIQVEAEDFSSMFGIQVEKCREGGENVGYITKGDWMDYIVDVPASGNYYIDFRVAGPGGTLQVKLPDDRVLATVVLPPTRSGQIYTTTTASIALEAGKQTIRIYAVTAYWNFNWFSITGQNEIPDGIGNSNSNNLILTSTFENESDFGSWIKEICRSDAVRISKEVSRKGQAAARFEFTKKDVLDFDGFSRAEIRRTSETDDERWYGFSNFLPADYVSDPLAEMIAQWHDVPDFILGETWRSPPISLKIVNDHYYIHYLWATFIINTDLTKSGEKKVDLGPVDKNKWNDWVFHIKFSYKSDGIIEIWKNRNKIFTFYGPNSYNDRSNPYFKLGIYKWGWNGWASYSPQDERVLFYDEVRIGNSNSSFEEVSPD